MSALWPIVHRCGHRVQWDLSHKHPNDRFGFARWLALRDCTSCWWAKRRRHEQQFRRRHRTRRPAIEVKTWELAIGMPALSGSDKTVVWAHKIRHRLIIAALQAPVHPRDATNQAVLAMIEHARGITAAGWWIDHRKVDPAHLAAALAHATADRRRRIGSRR